MATVLVVDDDPMNREFLRTLLVHRGHEVREAADGESALSLARNEPLDAVITDVLMPGTDGYELARQLRGQPATRRLPIAFSTAYFGRREIQPLAEACGVRDVILKPARPKAILEVIDALLESAPSTAEASTTDPASAAEQSSASGRTNTVEQREHGAHLADRLAETQRVTLSGTWDLDPRTGLVELSAGLPDLLGLPSTQQGLRQDSVRQRVHPDDVGNLVALTRHTLRTGQPHTFGLRITDAQNAVHELIVSCRLATGTGSGSSGSGGPSRSQNGGRLARSLWGVIQDVTWAREEQVHVREQAEWSAQRRLLDGIQLAMLPAGLPAVAGVDLATAYLPAADRLDIGGDWYDVVPGPDGGVLLSVGDVAGQQHDAASVMGQVRAVLRAYAIEDPDPSRVLARLNRFMSATYQDDTYVTAVVARYEPASRRLSLANAGHPAPLLVAPADLAGTPPRIARPTALGPALGIFPQGEFPSQYVTMPPGAAICAYTDGLTGRYADQSPGGNQRLAHVLTEAYRQAPSAGRRRSPTARWLLDHILDSMVVRHALDGDVCIAVLRTPGVPELTAT